MRYFLDTEFIEAGPRHPLQLISIGIVAEDGREFYAESADFDESLCNDFVRENILPKLGPSDGRIGNFEIATRITQWMMPQSTQPEIWGYYSDYDWVVFCQLYGTMMDLPNGLPFYCRDLKQWLDDARRLGVEKPADPMNAHNALADARWNQSLFTHLNERAGIARW